MIFSVGLVGLTGLLVMATRSNQAAYLRHQVTILAGYGRSHAQAVWVGSQGWRIELSIKGGNGKLADASERVVVTPAALFTTDTATFSTLILGSATLCDSVVQESVMLIDITNGGPGSGVLLLGGDNARTGGGLPVTTTLGAARRYCRAFP